MKELYNDKLKRSVKVGDTVIIKSLAEVVRINKQYKFHFCFAEEMYRFCGKKAKVVGVEKKYYEQLDGYYYYWSEPKPNRLAVDFIILDIDGGEYSWSLDMFQWKRAMLIENE